MLTLNASRGSALILRLSLAIALVVLLAAPLAAQTEYPPPSGKGRLVVVASGMSGPEHYATVSRAIAALGYDVVLFDGNKIAGTKGEGLQTAITVAQQMPHALPGKPGADSASPWVGVRCWATGARWRTKSQALSFGIPQQALFKIFPHLQWRV